MKSSLNRLYNLSFPTFSSLKFLKSFFNTSIDTENTVSLPAFTNYPTMNLLDEMDRSSQAYLSELSLSLNQRTCALEDRILTEQSAKQLRRWMPSRCKFATSWSLVYSSAQHGFSLNTLYTLCKSSQSIMMVIRDDNGNIFGAFLSDSPKPQIGHFGTGECFLWKYSRVNESESTQIDDTNSNTIQIYPSTGKNSYFIISEPEFLAIGCGDGKFGLLLDQDLFNGQTNTVPTFDNDILSSSRDFVCLGVEVWRFDTTQNM